MKAITCAGVCLLGGLLAAGCGSDEDDGAETENTPSQGTVNETVARSTTQTTLQAIATIRAGNGQQGAFQLIGASGGAAALITPPAQGQAQAQAQATNVGTVAFAETTGDAGCSCTENACTFTDCGDTTGYVLSGSMSWTATSMVCDLTITAEISGFSYAYNQTCDLTFTDSSIDGLLSTEGSYDYSGVAGAQGAATAGGNKVSWDVDVDYQSVTFNASSCPTGGTIAVSSTITSQGATYSASGDVSFDASTCGG